MVSARLAPAATTTTEASPDRLRVSGGMGVEGFDGTESGVAPRLRLQGSRWGERINTSLQLNFDPSGDDTPEFFDGRLEITPTGEASWVPFVRALIERDTHEALRYRTGLTLGFRYRFSESTENGLELLSGLGVSHGDWRGGYLDRPDFRLDRLRERETELNAHLGLRYRGDAPWGGAWGGFAELTPSLTDADEFRAGAGTMIEYPMSDRLRLRLDMVLRYEHDPALSGLDELGTRVGASLELDF